MIEKLSDVSDIASELEQNDRDLGVFLASQAVKPEQHPEFDGLHCVQCGEGIPIVRLQAGRVRCVVCQTLLERRK